MEQTSDSLGQRRHLTVLFSDLCDSTRLAQTMDPEHNSAMLKALSDLFQEIIARHRGRIASIQGDGVLAIFGYPEASEDEARRAINAALELHAAVLALALPEAAPMSEALALHSGIHAGLVFITPGDEERGRFAIGGEVANTAVRLSDLAERGQILISEEALGRNGRFYAVSELGPLHLKGRAQPLSGRLVHARVGEVLGSRVRSMREAMPFVGRGAEMGALRERLSAAVGGSVQCLVVTGGPGLGKTRLVEELIREATSEGVVALRGYCENPLSAEPLQPFLQMLRSILGVLPGMSAAEAFSAAQRALEIVSGIGNETRATLMHAISLVPADVKRRPLTTGEFIMAMCGLFDAYAGARPLLLFVDDVQWADDASLQALDAIRELRRPVLLLLASRVVGGEALSGPSRPVLELGPLESNETARFVEHLLPGVDPFVTAGIDRQAGGNPLFIEDRKSVV